MPGSPGSTRHGNSAGDHIHRLLDLAEALARAASHGSGADFGDHPGTRAGEPVAATPLGLELGSLPDRELVAWAQTAEHLNHFLQGVLVQAAGELATRTRAGRFTAKGVTDPAGMLVATLKLGKAEAYRRMRLAEHLLPVPDAIGPVLAPPRQPALGTAFFGGQLSAEQALIVSAFTDDAAHLANAGRIDPGMVTELEETLTEYARDQAPDFLHRVGVRAVNLLDPDGQQPTDGELLAKQGIFFRRARRGLVHFDGHLTLAQYEQMMAGIGQATNPRDHADINDRLMRGIPLTTAKAQPATAPETEPAWPHRVDGISIPEPGSDAELPGLDPIAPAGIDPAVKDRRTHGQRLLDGMIDCIKLAARTGKLPLNGGLKPQVFITIAREDLSNGKGTALAPYCGPSPLADFEELICDAEITEITFGKGQRIINVGRTRRLFTAAQRKILVARDMGCAFPDCTRPAPWTEAHHIIAWKDGGETSLENGVLLCTPHHHLLHGSDWQVAMVDGIPFFTPPPLLDPTGRARRNTYHHGYPRAGAPAGTEAETDAG
ncbi:hypothetical protein AL755_05720 [Arthrobacter sp. ERGS1:01]|nr:hypothetical protein AL755_05720 [Arthrobacter sp. ERGS1:01]